MKRGEIIYRKVCYKCKQEKDISQFRIYPSGVNKGLYHSYCNDCKRKYNNDHNKKYFQKNPWCRLAVSISARCSPTGDYFKNGIKKNINVAELKKLWFRDKAWLLKQPSIDRIDSHGDYSYENCRFIELKENLRKSIGERNITKETRIKMGFNARKLNLRRKRDSITGKFIKGLVEV